VIFSACSSRIKSGVIESYRFERSKVISSESDSELHKSTLININTMNKQMLESTLASFLKAWEQKSIDAVVNLLANSFEYYESPLDKPLTNSDQIRELWSPVPKFEADIKLSFKTLSIEDDFGFFRIEGTYDHTYKRAKKTTHIDRIFLLAVDRNGKIIRFMQWRESKDS